MLNAGLSEVFYVNIIMCMFGFHSRMLFILRLFPLPPSLFGEASTRAFLD